MKSFTTYLTESARTYDFRIRIACEMTDDIVNKIKSVLEAYKVESISKPKRLPIQESPLFPNMGPVEINIMDVCLCYPTTDARVLNLIAECGCAPASCIKVTPTNSPFEATLAGLEQSNLQKPGESVLMNPDMVTEKHEADLVGDARIPSLIKELEELKQLLFHYRNEEKTKVEELKRDYTNLINSENYKKIKMYFHNNIEENESKK